MRNHDGGTIPFAMSDVGPCELVTAKNMSPEQIARAREEALMVGIENGKRNEENRKRWQKVAAEIDEKELVAK